MQGTIRIFLGKDEVVVERAPLILSEEDGMASEQILKRAIRAFPLHRKS
jgi:hypothetical protein